MIYGDTNRRGPRTNYQSRYQVSSPAYSRAPIDPRDRIFAPTPTPNRTRLNKYEVSDVILATREEADKVIERLIDILEKYDVASLADLYDLLGLQTSPIDNKWGWTYLGSVQVRQIRQGYLLDLPHWRKFNNGSMVSRCYY